MSPAMRFGSVWRSTSVCVAALTAAVFANGARAQERTPAATGSSERAAFQVQGLPAGSFRIYPSVRLSVSYDDNVTFRQTDKISDGIVTVAPTVAARSQWANHQLDALAFVRSSRYFENGSQNNDEYGASANGRLDVDRSFAITGSAGYSHLVESRGTPGDLLTSSRFVEYDLARASVQARKQFNRIGIAAGVGGADFRYDGITLNGLPVDQSFRDRNTRNVNGRIDYQYSSTASLFLSGSANRIRYRDAGITDRGSNGYSILGGAQFELTRLLRGEVGVGYIAQSFRNPQFSDFRGLNYNLNLTYAPTQLTSFTLTGSRELTDSALVQVAGVLASRVAVGVEHELLRNLLISADANYTNYKYRGIERSEDRFGFGAGARYKLNRYLSAALSYDRVSQDTAAVSGRSYRSNRISLSLVVAR